MTQRPLISLRDVGLRAPKNARRDWLVHGVNLTLHAGEIITLVGPNGSGKSTTAKLALGLLKPDQGTIERAARKIAYVPQKIAIDWTLPLSVNRFMSLTQALNPQEIDDALTLTGASALKNMPVRSLSGGEFQRVMLARALARRPDLLVLDEPVQGVDYTGEIALYKLITKIRDELNCGILLISHDLHIVMAATDQVLCLNGHVCCQGSPSHVLESPAYRELFGHGEASPLALYQHHHDHDHQSDGTLKALDESPHV